MAQAKEQNGRAFFTLYGVGYGEKLDRPETKFAGR